MDIVFTCFLRRSLEPRCNNNAGIQIWVYMLSRVLRDRPVRTEEEPSKTKNCLKVETATIRTHTNPRRLIRKQSPIAASTRHGNVVTTKFVNAAQATFPCDHPVEPRLASTNGLHPNQTRPILSILFQSISQDQTQSGLLCLSTVDACIFDSGSWWSA